ncbi:MAG: uroporphyrinogen-III C-methyltransferase [Burkholderiaceae bacterium]|jgi:uroporphyrin-3 C-methyltransferase/uroporphyrinogen III methyltransferase/synthase
MENASLSSNPVAQVPLSASRASSSNWLGLLALVVAVLGCALAWLNHNRFESVERELARRVQTIDSSANESHVLSKQAQDQVLALQTRVGVLESKLSESQSQQASLEQLYQDLSRTRDDWALAEVEQILSVASQQLQLAGNVQGALIALQNADNRLARADRPQFIPLRRVIAHDMDRLRALPSVDLAGNALRIDSLVSMVDTLPLLSDERPVEGPRLDAQPVDRGPRVLTAKDGSQHKLDPGWFERVEDAWRYATAELWQEVQQLIRIREVNEPDALLLTPSQSYFLRENLKLRLLNARLALLARQEPIYRADLLRAEEMLQKYFDNRSRQTGVALSLLKQIEASNTVVELPTLAESLTAVRNFKAPHDH